MLNQPKTLETIRKYVFREQKKVAEITDNKENGYISYSEYYREVSLFPNESSNGKVRN